MPLYQSWQPSYQVHVDDTAAIGSTLDRSCRMNCLREKRLFALVDSMPG
jgi:hypothetical protein